MSNKTVGTCLATALALAVLALSGTCEADASPLKVRHVGKPYSQQRGAELSMVQLQSVVSQRQLAVQATTSVLAKTQPCKQCINNIR